MCLKFYFTSIFGLLCSILSKNSTSLQSIVNPTLGSKIQDLHGFIKYHRSFIQSLNLLALQVNIRMFKYCTSALVYESKKSQLLLWTFFNFIISFLAQYIIPSARASSLWLLHSPKNTVKHKNASWLYKISYGGRILQ